MQARTGGEKGRHAKETSLKYNSNKSNQISHLSRNHQEQHTLIHNT